MRAIHKRTEVWAGVPFAALDEAADFLAELEPKVRPADGVASSASVSTEEREFRELTIDELRELSKAVPLESTQSLYVFCERDGDQAVRVSLLLNERRSTTKLEVEGEEEVVVDGLYVGAKKRIEGGFAAMKQAQELAAVKSDSSEGPASWKQWLNHPWGVQVIGGSIAALIAAGVVLLLSH